MDGGARTDRDDRPGGTARGRLLRRIRGEFSQMPGLRLTRDQANRLWSLPENACDRMLRELENSGFLRRLDKGRVRHT